MAALGMEKLTWICLTISPLSLSSGGGRREGGRELCVTALRKRIVSGA
jgi:hypothetical protein